jgi:transposase-like protein
VTYNNNIPGTYQEPFVEKQNLPECPICYLTCDVRISGSNKGEKQYYCKHCKFYYAMSAVNAIRKRIWHDKIDYGKKRILDSLTRNNK